MGLLESPIENIHLNKKLDAMEVKIQQLKSKNYEKKMLTDKKGFERLAVFTGEERMFGDWELKLHQFIRPEIGLETFLDEVKDLEKEPGVKDLEELLEQLSGSRTTSRTTFVFRLEQLFSSNFSNNFRYLEQLSRTTL